MFHCLVNTMYGQTGQAAKVLHVSKGFKPNISPLLVICLGRYVDLTRLRLVVSQHDPRGCFVEMSNILLLTITHPLYKR
jgi:hypothetical protein